MKTRIATSFGLALVLVFGIIGVLIAFGPQEAQAQTDPDRVINVKVEAVPNTPNTVAKWTIEFVNGDEDNNLNILRGGTGNDVIRIEFEDDVQFPPPSALTTSL